MTPAFVEHDGPAFRLPGQAHLRVHRGPTVTTSTDDDPFEGTGHGRARGRRGRVAGVRPGTGTRRGTGEPRVSCGCAAPSCSRATPTPQQTNEAIAAGGWFRTGDLATVDADGWLRIVGRLKDVIIRGGENISASEVEAVLEAHPDVRQAVAVGYPDPLMGERVAAFVVVRARSASTSAGDGSPAGAWPRSRRRSGSSSRTCRCSASGKADRAALQRRAAATSVLRPVHGGNAVDRRVSVADAQAHRSLDLLAVLAAPHRALRGAGRRLLAGLVVPRRAERHGRDVRAAPLFSLHLTETRGRAAPRSPRCAWSTSPGRTTWWSIRAPPASARFASVRHSVHARRTRRSPAARPGFGQDTTSGRSIGPRAWRPTRPPACRGTAAAGNRGPRHRGRRDRFLVAASSRCMSTARRERVSSRGRVDGETLQLLQINGTTAPALS